MDLTEIFRCPQCGGLLHMEDENLASADCGASYQIREGIPCFASEDDFYEGKFAVPTQDGVAQREGVARGVKAFYDRFSSTTVKHQFTRHFLKKFGPETLILDVGCGGGNELLKDYQTVGIDLSFTGLTAARDIYQAVATADALKLPFADDTFDIISSWDVFGHVPVPEKGPVLAEWKRVLKPGGYMLHIIEAHCTAPYYKLVRRDEGLFEKYFIEMDGHYGLELPSEITERFEQAGFQVEKSWSFYRGGIFPPEEYAKRLAAGPEYAESSKVLKAFGAFGSLCARNKQLDRAASFATGLAARAVNPLLPLDWGSTFFIICRG
jgi:ubiquinone/menaquinone biosynthesis C-methylase UbiE